MTPEEASQYSAIDGKLWELLGVPRKTKNKSMLYKRMMGLKDGTIRGPYSSEKNHEVSKAPEFNNLAAEAFR